MKPRNIGIGFILSMLILFFTSCENLFNGDDNTPENEYLSRFEMEGSYLPAFISKFIQELEPEYPGLAQIRERVNYGVIIYKIEYKTTFQGETVTASGLVAAPAGEGPFPVLSYQNGTNTLHRNAPSVNPDFELYAMLEAVASTGFVISLPDYLGFGASDDLFHPYLHGESTVQTVLDMLHAVRELAAMSTFTISNDLYLAGYSQGGWATMQVQKEIESGNSAGYLLKASAPGAGPYDLNYINTFILEKEEYPMPYFTAYIFDSYQKLGIIQTPISQVYQSPYSDRIPTLFNGSLTGDSLNNQLTTSVTDLFTGNYRQNHSTDAAYASVRQALTNNSITGWNTDTPTRIIHGKADAFVPYAVSENIYQDFISAGSASVELIPMNGLGHSDGIIPAGLLSIGWFLELTSPSVSGRLIP